MVVLEVMYFGVPVISTATAGPKEIIQDSLDGVVLDQIQIELWRKAILNLFSDLSKKDDMGNKAKRKIRTQFLWSHLCKNYLEVYEELLEK
jgi:glycosyltransferase involved in cell wall biosynthesis